MGKVKHRCDLAACVLTAVTVTSPGSAGRYQNAPAPTSSCSPTKMLAAQLPPEQVNVGVAVPNRQQQCLALQVLKLGDSSCLSDFLLKRFVALSDAAMHLGSIADRAWVVIICHHRGHHHADHR